MPLVIPPGYGSAALEFEGAAGTPTHITTIGVDLSAAGGDFVAAANNVFQSYAETLLANTANTLTLTRVTLAVGQDGPGGSVVSSLPPEDGGQAGSFEVISMAVIARKVTNSLGRRGRGRMFLPGILASNDADIDGNINPTDLALWQTKLDQFWAALTIGFETSEPPLVQTPPTPPVLLHSEAPTTPTPIQSLAAQPVVGWIRGRIR